MMKKLMALASMMIVLSVSAQQRPQGSNQQQNNRVERKQTNSVDQQLKKFDQYNLTTSQKKKVKTLLQSNLSTSNFNKKLEKILSKKQYAQYIKDQKVSNKNNARQQSKTIDYRQAQKSK